MIKESENAAGSSDVAAENQQLRRRIKDVTEKSEKLSSKFKVDITEFAKKSQQTLAELNQQVLSESAEANKMLHTLTLKYEEALQRQIDLLTENQKHVEEKEKKEQQFNKQVEEVTGQYEEKISKLEGTLKDNVKKVNKMQGSGVLRALLKNQRFQAEVKKLGGDVETIQKGIEIDAVVREIAEKDAEIAVLTENNKNIDEEVKKTEEMMGTFQKLLDNMQAEKINLTKQNIVLIEKLKQSREILSKLLPMGDLGE